jgi:hypothetical protein
MKKNGSMSGLVKLILMAFVLTLVLSGSPVLATEGPGVSHYAGGNEDFMAGALPPPGFYQISYGAYYTASKLNDKDGNGIPIDIKANIYVYAFRPIYVTKMKILGADWAMHAIIPLESHSVKIGAFGVDKQSSGLGDIEFSPLVLGWHFSKNMHLIGGVDVIAPTGSYDKADESSIGRNYWTINPILAATYISDGGFEVSGKFQYLFNTENTDTKYTSGNELICDYTVGQHIGDWKFGVNGYLYKQITDDEQNGVKQDWQGQSISVGPAIQYNYKNMFFNAKYQWDTAVKSRLEGQKLWLKFMYAF